MATVEMADGSILWTWPIQRDLLFLTSELMLFVEVVRCTSAFEMVLGQKMFRIRRQQQFWNVSSLRPMALVNFHNSHPYKSLVRTLLLKKFVVWSFYADLLAFPDVFEGVKCLPFLGEPCFDLWLRVSIGGHLGA